MSRQFFTKCQIFVSKRIIFNGVHYVAVFPLLAKCTFSSHIYHQCLMHFVQHHHCHFSFKVSTNDICISNYSKTIHLTSNQIMSCPHRDTFPANHNSKDMTFNWIFSDSNKARVQERLKTMSPTQILDQFAAVDRKKRIAAVLVPLCTVGGEPSFLLTLRTPSLRNYSGHVSFPGGIQDEMDKNVTCTALRETFEEIGLVSDDFDVWDILQPLPLILQAGLLYPILARYIPELDVSDLRLNPNEVQEAFTVQIRDFINGGRVSVRSTQFTTGGGFTCPVFIGGPHRIWGLTAAVLHMVLNLIAPSVYNFKF